MSPQGWNEERITWSECGVDRRGMGGNMDADGFLGGSSEHFESGRGGTRGKVKMFYVFGWEEKQLLCTSDLEENICHDIVMKPHVDVGGDAEW